MEVKQNYIKMLEQKRDIQIPEAIKELKSKLKMLQREKSNIDFEIQLLKTTERGKIIFDLPSLVWRKITKMLIQPQNETHALSLSSEMMATFVDTVLEGSSGFVKMEKAFSVLLTNFYLDRDDLLNCIETTSAELGKLAARTWLFLENPNYQSVDVIGSIQYFRAEIEQKKAEHKIWTCFAGRTTQFNLRHCPSESWETSKDILQKYGEFFVYIELWLDPADLATAEKTDYIQNMLLDGKLPNLQFFYVNGRQLTFTLRPKIETRSLLNYICLSTRTFGPNSVDNYNEIFKLSQFIAEAWCINSTMHAVSFQKLKSLIDCSSYPNEKLIENVITAQCNGLMHTKELALFGYFRLEQNLKLAQKLPALSTISIKIPPGIGGGNRHTLIVSRNIRIPTVRTLIYWLDCGPGVLRLCQLFHAFPSLRGFTLKTQHQRHEFAALWTRVVDGWAGIDHRNKNDGDYDALEDFDIYQLLSNGQPLTESSIWEEVPKLIVACVISATGNLLLGNKSKSNMIEKYTRVFGDRESIRVERYLESTATHVLIV